MANRMDITYRKEEHALVTQQKNGDDKVVLAVVCLLSALGKYMKIPGSQTLYKLR